MVCAAAVCCPVLLLINTPMGLQYLEALDALSASPKNSHFCAFKSQLSVEHDNVILHPYSFSLSNKEFKYHSLRGVYCLVVLKQPAPITPFLHLPVLIAYSRAF